MAAKKKTKKTNILKKEVDADTQSVAIGSAISVLFALLLKSLFLAIPVGLAFAFAHKHGLSKKKKKK